MFDFYTALQSIGTSFYLPKEEFVEKCQNLKVLIFDWDGVFNSGEKQEVGGSSFFEPDSMFINMLRFSLWLKNGHIPKVFLISGEKNEAAFHWANREKIKGIYYKTANKLLALEHLKQNFDIKESSIGFFFDDILDLGVAEKVLLRLQIRRPNQPVFNHFIEKKGLADLATSSSQFAIREACEAIIAAIGNYDEVMTERMHHSAVYQAYLKERNAGEVHCYTAKNNEIYRQNPIQ